MHLKRFLFGFVLISSIALSFGNNDEIKEETVLVEEVALQEKDVSKTEVIVDVEEETHLKEATVLQKKTTPDAAVVHLEKDEKEFNPKSSPKKDSHHENLDSYLNIRKSDVSYSDEWETFGNFPFETATVSTSDDEDRFYNDASLAVLIDEILLDPIDSLLQLLIEILRKVLVNLDEILAKLFEFVAKVIDVIFILIVTLPLLIINLLADLLPGVFGVFFTEFRNDMNECTHYLHRIDPINQTFVELEQCITDPLFNIVEDVVEILVDVQKILGKLKQGLFEIEDCRKASDAFAQVVEIVLDVVHGILEIVADLIAGPVTDIIVLLPVLIACIVGDITKNLIGGIFHFLKEYGDCWLHIIPVD